VDTSELRKQHDSILHQIGKIRDLMQSNDEGAVLTDIGRRLDVLSTALGHHLTLEDREYYPAFLKSGEELVRTTAERFFVEMGHFRRVYSNFRDEWRWDRILPSKLKDFAYAAERVFSLLETRIQKENDVLFPMWESAMGVNFSVGENQSRFNSEASV